MTSPQEKQDSRMRTDYSQTGKSKVINARGKTSNVLTFLIILRPPHSALFRLVCLIAAVEVKIILLLSNEFKYRNQNY